MAIKSTQDVLEQLDKEFAVMNKPKPKSTMAYKAQNGMVYKITSIILVEKKPEDVMEDKVQRASKDMENKTEGWLLHGLTDEKKAVVQAHIDKLKAMIK